MNHYEFFDINWMKYIDYMIYYNIFVLIWIMYETTLKNIFYETQKTMSYIKTLHIPPIYLTRIVNLKKVFSKKLKKEACVSNC